MKITRNMIRCKKCDDVIESKHVHEFRWCKCGAVAVDGGLDYCKRVGYPNNYEELSDSYEELSVTEGERDDQKRLECSFKLSHYEDMLTLALKEGFMPLSFRDYSANNKGNDKILLLRHDVDFRLDRALEMAKIEADLDIAATYFIRLHSPSYNPFGFKEYKILRELYGMNMEIGLHTEAKDVEELTGESYNEVFYKEHSVLVGIIGRPIYSMVEHSDFTGVSSRFLLEDGNMPLAGWCGEKFNHPHSEQFKEFAYFSDSCGDWGDRGCPCDWLLKTGKYMKIQINTHPCYWYREHYHLE